MRQFILIVLFLSMLILPLPARAALTPLQSAVTGNAMGTVLDVTRFSRIYVEVIISGTATVGFQAQGIGVGASYNPLYCMDISTEARALETGSTSKYVCNVEGSANFQAPVSNCNACTVTVNALGNTGNIGTLLSGIALNMATGAGSAGAANAVQSSDGASGFVDSGLIAASGRLLLSGTVQASLPSAASLSNYLINCTDCKNPSDAAYAAGTCAAGGTGRLGYSNGTNWIC